MYALISFATQWGSKHGGINSFNADFMRAFGIAYHLNAEVICIVASASEDEVENAHNAHVTLVPLPYPPQEKIFGQAHAQTGIDEINHRSINFDPAKTIWLGHDRFTGEAAIFAAKNTGGRSALIHHMSYDHYESYAENSKAAYEKTQAQMALFNQADLALAVGPLLRDALNSHFGDSKPVYMIVPGLAEIEPRNAPKIFTAFLSGRLSDDAARIKQGHLGIAAFAKAQQEARDNKMPECLCKQPKLVLRGIDFEVQTSPSTLQSGHDLETELKTFAEEYAQCVINLHALPYTQDRETLYSDLKSASVALMPSWHEGFGLVAWEGIAAGVPLIISKNSGVYCLLEEEYPGAGPGCVYPIEVRGALSSPFFHQEDLKAAVSALKEIADKPENARKKAAILRGMLEKFTWSACAEQAASIFQWPLEKGSIRESIPVSIAPVPGNVASNTIPYPPATTSPLQIPAKRWKAGIGMADSYLLRAEEELVPFDPARLPELDKLNTWLDNQQWPQAVRLITGGGGAGKTRLALELCRQRLVSGWQAGLLSNDLDVKEVQTCWQTLRNFNQPILIVIDYAETRQTVILSLIKVFLQNSGSQPVRMLLLARDGGEWWDNLPGKDQYCEPLLGGYATSGPFRLPALYTSGQDRHQAYTQALQTFSNTLGVAIPDVVPELTGEHFEKPLYIQMAALLALYGEQPTTAGGLTKALLNHERRYWRGLLAPFNWPEPERLAQRLLALATLAGGFATPKAAEPYWKGMNTSNISNANFASLFHSLAALYPGKQGLQAVRPDLIGEALVAQILLWAEADTLLDAVLSNSAGQLIRQNALTILARISNYRLDLHEILADALIRQFKHCCQDIVTVSRQTNSRLPELAEKAFSRLSSSDKSQAAGLLSSTIIEESVQLAELNCLVAEYLAEKSHEKWLKKKNNVGRMADYAGALSSYSSSLYYAGHDNEAIHCALKAKKIFAQLKEKDQNRYEPAYAGSLINYSNHLSNAGQDQEALAHTKQSLEIRQRLAERNPDRFAQDLFVCTCFEHFLSWLNEPGGMHHGPPHLKTIPAKIPAHQHSLMLLFSAFVIACQSSDPPERSKAFQQVISCWGALSLKNKQAAKEYWLCAAGWCSAFFPSALAGINWQDTWHQYINQRQGHLPHWMQTVAQRLLFDWPA